MNTDIFTSFKSSLLLYFHALSMSQFFPFTLSFTAYDKFA
jgi:hypothetical protein